MWMWTLPLLSFCPSYSSHLLLSYLPYLQRARQLDFSSTDQTLNFPPRIIWLPLDPLTLFPCYPTQRKVMPSKFAQDITIFPFPRHTSLQIPPFPVLTLFTFPPQQQSLPDKPRMSLSSSYCH